MKKVFIGLLSVLCSVMVVAKDYEPENIFDVMEKGDKVAILMVHFGTTHESTRKLTIDVLNRRVKEAYPQIEVREAYTSRIVMKRLKDKFGIHKDNPQQALLKLAADGYTHILVQSTTLIDGVEMLSIYENVRQMRSFFKQVRVGKPLLYDVEDYDAVVSALTAGNKSKQAYAWVGHGTSHSATAQYAMLAYVLQSKGVKNVSVGTIEGFPGYDDVLRELKATKCKQVELVPFMLVAGEHAVNDIAQDWKEELQKAGFQVSVRMEGLGQNVTIQNIYLQHLQKIVDFRPLDIMNKKSVYVRTGEKMKD